MTHRILLVRLLVLGLGMLVLPIRLGAQSSCTVLIGGSCSTSATVSINVGPVVQLDQASTTVTLGTPSVADYTTGYQATTGPSLTIKSNAAWTLGGRTAVPAWTATNTSPGVSARAAKPASDLEWSLTSGGIFTGFTTTATSLRSGSATAGTIQPLHFRTLYNWSLDTPGAYSLAVVFTVSSP